MYIIVLDTYLLHNKPRHLRLLKEDNVSKDFVLVKAYRQDLSLPQICTTQIIFYNNIIIRTINFTLA